MNSPEIDDCSLDRDSESLPWQCPFTTLLLVQRGQFVAQSQVII
ncbi:MAG: hypothetical protein WA828_06165 [Coleofasciculaceae cyanobacterium]